MGMWYSCLKGDKMPGIAWLMAKNRERDFPVKRLIPVEGKLFEESILLSRDLLKDGYISILLWHIP